MKNQLDYMDYLKKEISLIEKALQNYIKSQHPFINQVSEYIVFSGGKRIRPLLSVISARLFSQNGIPFDEEHTVYKTSILFEYLHAATLLHDDVVDSAEFRRGRKAARNIWGNQATILVGDYLYAKSLKIASALKDPEIMEVITHTTLLMSEGEVLQLINLDNTELTFEDYEEVIFRKTAVLISACCEVGALLGGADEKHRENMKNFGKYIGLAFQVVDDLLDYTSVETGKDLGKDFKEGKITLPVIYTLQSASPEEKEELIYLLKKEEPDNQDFERAVKIIKKYQGFSRTKEKAEEYVKLAREKLNEVPENYFKNVLNFIADYIIHRKK